MSHPAGARAHGSADVAPSIVLNVIAAVLAMPAATAYPTAGGVAAAIWAVQVGRPRVLGQPHRVSRAEDNRPFGDCNNDMNTGAIYARKSNDRDTR